MNLDLGTIQQIVRWVGVFFALEGGANLVWWHFFPPSNKVNSMMENVWEAGRVLRTVLGIVLVAVSLFI